MVAYTVALAIVIDRRLNPTDKNTYSIQEREYARKFFDEAIAEAQRIFAGLKKE
jgi:uncharacterized membrane protein